MPDIALFNVMLPYWDIFACKTCDKEGGKRDMCAVLHTVVGTQITP